MATEKKVKKVKLTEAELLLRLESMLFVASGSVPIARMAQALSITPKRTEKLLAKLEVTYETRGIRLQWNRGGVQMTTAPEASATIEHFLGLESITRLSQAAVEVLSIIAYTQPTTRPGIDKIRGVNSDGSLRSLLSKGLIEEVGRQDTPGRPILYGTTTEFLQHFGLKTIEQLPELGEEEPEVDGLRAKPIVIEGAEQTAPVDAETELAVETEESAE